jgi:hypothetical protein
MGAVVDFDVFGFHAQFGDRRKVWDGHDGDLSKPPDLDILICSSLQPDRAPTFDRALTHPLGQFTSQFLAQSGAIAFFN